MPSPGKVLLVDDDQEHILMCTTILEKNGYEVKGVTTCNDLKELLDIVTNFRPGLIFMDHRMTGISGLHATRLLKGNLTTKHIPVIYFSAEDNVAELAEKAGADAFLRKPRDLDKLGTVASIYL